ncbi:MAG: esterase [Planctomycetes bacterium]|jgi:phospholipase/carboxylesterase|nr:esterase [Planctomycetota bacterium]
MAFLDISWQTFRPEEGFYTSETATPQPLPIRTFAPVGYEPRYAYPLLVFLHGHGGNEEQILRLAPRVSRRNYVAIGLRGPVCLGTNRKGSLGFSWGDSSQLPMIEDYLLGAIQETRRNYHIHSERIFLAGYGEGATLAYRMGLEFPDRIGGVIALNGHMPREDRPLLRLPEVRSLHAFIGHGIANSVVPLSMACEDYRLLWSAGLDVEMHRYPTTHRLHKDMLRDVNRWIITRFTDV